VTGDEAIRPARLPKDIADTELHLRTVKRADLQLDEQAVAMGRADQDIEPATRVGVAIGVDDIESRACARCGS
jgi:hypothetical protein